MEKERGKTHTHTRNVSKCYILHVNTCHHQNRPSHLIRNRGQHSIKPRLTISRNQRQGITKVISIPYLPHQTRWNGCLCWLTRLRLRGARFGSSKVNVLSSDLSICIIHRLDGIDVGRCFGPCLNFFHFLLYWNEMVQILLCLLWDFVFLDWLLCGVVWCVLNCTKTMKLTWWRSAIVFFFPQNCWLCVMFLLFFSIFSLVVTSCHLNCRDSPKT